MKRFFRIVSFYLLFLLWAVAPVLGQSGREVLTRNNAADLEELLFLPHRDRVINMDMAWSPDGTLFGLAGGGGLRLYRIGDDAELLFQLGADESKRTITFNQDASLVAASDGGTEAVWLWDTRTGERAAIIDVGDYYSEMIAFGVDGMWLATTDVSGDLSLWTVRNSAGTQVPFTPANAFRVERETHLWSSMKVQSMISSTDGFYLYTADGNDLISIWNVSNGTIELDFEHPGLRGALDANHERLLIASGGEGGDVIIWGLGGVAITSILADPDNRVNATAFNPDGSLLAVANAGVVRVYDIHDLQNVGEPLFVAYHDYYVRDLGFSPDGTLLATMGTSDGVRFWGVGSTLNLLLPPTPTPRPAPTATPEPVLTIGGTARVQASDGDTLNVRSGPGRGFDIVTNLANDTLVTLTDGPQEADGFRWWKIRTADGVEGWAVEVAEDERTLIPVGS